MSSASQSAEALTVAEVFGGEPVIEGGGMIVAIV